MYNNIHIYKCHLHTEVIVLSATQDPLNQLFLRFWSRENKHTLNFADDVTALLRSLKIPYATDRISGEIDLTKCFNDGFKQSCHKWVLNFLVHEKLSNFPPSVTEICISYLSSVAQGKPERHIIERTAHVITF